MALTSELLIVAVLNIVMGLLILIFPGMLRFLVGGYLLINGLLILLWNVL